MSILDKMRKARQRRVEAGGLTFILRCPSDIEAARMGKANTTDLLQFVIGWEGVQEIHLYPGGSAVDAPWSAEVCQEFLAFRPDLWDALVSGVLALYTEHVAALEDATKN
jgi:hypothetical protein